LVLLLVLASTAYGQYEILSFDFTGGGARAAGMGKAYLAVSDNVNGLSWNPAGIHLVEKPVMGGSWSSLAPRGDATTLSASHIWRMEHSGSVSNISDFSFAAPVRVKGHQFVGSFTFTRAFDAFDDLETYYEGDLEDEVLGTVYAEQMVKTGLSGGVNVFNLGFGTRLYSNLSFGLSANIYTGSVLRESEQNLFLPDVFLEHLLQNADLEQLTTVMDTNKVSGMNFTIGFKYSGEQTSTGLIVKTPFEMKMDYDLIFYNLVTINGLIEDDGTDTVYFMENVTKYDMPWTIGLGVAHQATENLLLAGDVEYRAFQGGKIYTRDSVLINPGADNIEYWTEWDPRWKNTFTIRLGGEYLWRTGIGTIPLRAGTSYCQFPNKKIEIDFAGFVERSGVSCQSFSLGTGIHWEQIRFDGAYTYSASNDERFLAYEISTRNHHLGISFTGVF